VFDQQLLGNELGKRVATYYQVMAHKIHKHMWNHLSQNTRTNVEPSLSCAQLIFLTKIKKICETLQNRNLSLWGSISFKPCRVFFFFPFHASFDFFVNVCFHFDFVNRIWLSALLDIISRIQCAVSSILWIINFII
jgi:hypothetical protein